MEQIYTIRLVLSLGITAYAIWWIHRNGGIRRFLRLVRTNIAAERAVHETGGHGPSDIWRTGLMAAVLTSPFVVFGAFIVSASGELASATIPALLALVVVASVFKNRRRKGRALSQPVQSRSAPPRTDSSKTAVSPETRAPATTEPVKATIQNLVIFKSGERPSDEQWYIQEVCRSIHLPVNDLEGGHIDVRYVDSSDLHNTYVIGYAKQAGFDVTRCTLTPFEDRDGGRGLGPR